MITNNEALVFTDICYILREGDSSKLWQDGLGALGFSEFIQESTSYGDWEASLFKVSVPVKTLEELVGARMIKLGNLCADAGEVCMVKLSELLKYNPDFIKTRGQWTYAILPERSLAEEQVKLKWDYEPNFKETGSAIIYGVNVETEFIEYIVKQTGY